MNTNKGFTLVELIAVIAIIGILSGIAVGAVSKYQIKARNETYKNYEDNLNSATKNYLLYNTGEIPGEGLSKDINSDNLIQENYLDEMVDPVNNKKKCRATVKVTNKPPVKVTNKPPDNDDNSDDDNSKIQSSNTTNIDLDFKVCLVCENYKSKGC